jgi:hypothetical protein
MALAAIRPGEAWKYAQTMLRQLTVTRADFLAIKEVVAGSLETNSNK